MLGRTSWEHARGIHDRAAQIAVVRVQREPLNRSAAHHEFHPFMYFFAHVDRFRAVALASGTEWGREGKTLDCVAHICCGKGRLGLQFAAQTRGSLLQSQPAIRGWAAYTPIV